MEGKEKLNEDSIEKKLKSFNNSQDSVQAVSLWIMHHKAQHRKIVDTWLKVMRKSDMKHKLTLFYLCNDVVQHAKRKKALYYLSCYKDILREATYIVSEFDSIKPNIMRILNIWEERKIYDRKYVKELKAILENESGTSSKNSSANATPNTPTTYKPVKPLTKVEKIVEEKKEVQERKKEVEERKKEVEERKKEVEEKKKEEEVKKEEVKPVMKDMMKDMTDKEREEMSSRIVAEFKELFHSVEGFGSGSGSGSKLFAKAITSHHWQPTKFIDSITMLRRLEGEIDLKRKQLTTLRIDATSLEAVKQLKDRSHGKEFCKQFEDSCIKIEDYVNTLEREITQRKAVLMMCENSEIFYDEQFKEAKIVANAYKNFGARVNNMKKKVDDKKKVLPATPSPVPSPSADAPSPGNTPPLQDMDDNEQIDMDLDEEQDSSKHNEPSPTMGAGRIAYTAMVKSIDQPISSISMGPQGLPPKKEKVPTAEPVPVAAPLTAPLLAPVGVPEPVPAPVPNVYNPKPVEKPKIEPFTIGNVLESRIASMLPNLSMGTSTLGSKFKPIPPVQQIQPITTTISAPVATYTETMTEKIDGEDNSDERASTPVMDEPEEEKERTPPRARTPEKPKPVVTTSSATTLKTNPIDFLSQLLTKTTKSSSSSNFLHSLSLLTNTVKSQYQKKQDSVGGSSSVNMDTPASSVVNVPLTQEPVSASASSVEAPLSSSWAGWKINAAQPPLPPQPNTEHPPPPIPTIPISAPPPGSSLLPPPQPPFPPPPQIPPQPPSPLPTPPTLAFPNTPNQSYPGIPEASQRFPGPQSSVFQPLQTESSFTASAPQTYTAPGASVYPVASSQSYPVSTSAFIDPSLPPPPPISQPSQSFSTSPGRLNPRPSLMMPGPRPAYPPSGESPSFPGPSERSPFPAAPSEKPSYSPAGDSKGFTPTTGFNQILMSYGGPPNPPPEPNTERQSFSQPPTPWAQASSNPPPPNEQGRGYGMTSHLWDRPPPGPPPETTAPLPSQFQTQRPYAPWDQSKPGSNVIDQPPPPGPPSETNLGHQNRFPSQEGYTSWNKPGHQQYRGQWEQPDMELESPPPEPETPPLQPSSGPAKGILRKRNSSLKEVTLVDSQNTSNDSYGYVSPVTPSPIERYTGEGFRNPPFGSAIKKPPTDIIQSEQPTDVQSEFIAKLKRKSGGPNLMPPGMSGADSRSSYQQGRVHSNLTTIEPTPAHLIPETPGDVVPVDPNVYQMVLEEEDIENITHGYKEEEQGSDGDQNDKDDRNPEQHYGNYHEREQVSNYSLAHSRDNSAGGHVRQFQESEHAGQYQGDLVEQFHESEHARQFRESEHAGQFRESEHARRFSESEHVGQFQESEPTSQYQESEHVGRFEEEQSRSRDGEDEDEPRSSFEERISSFQERQQHSSSFQLGSLIGLIQESARHVATKNKMEEADNASSNDMDLVDEEENQASETAVPESENAGTGNLVQEKQLEKQSKADDKPKPMPLLDIKPTPAGQFFRSRPPQPRFDQRRPRGHRPRESFRPYHRPYHDRYRGPRPRSYYDDPSDSAPSYYQLSGQW